MGLARALGASCQTARVPVVSPRIAERLGADFGPSTPRALSALACVPVAAGIDPERVHAAVVLVARGSLTLFDDAVEHAADDVRDLLDRAGLGEGDWRDRVDDEFGPNEDA